MARGRLGDFLLLATMEDPAVITRILTHSGLSLDAAEPDPGTPAPRREGRAGA
jgi:hypothetical protein